VAGAAPVDATTNAPTAAHTAAQAAAAAVAAKTATAAYAPDVHTCINPTFGVWSCCLVKKIISPYFTVHSVKGRRPALYFTVSLSEGPKARTFFSVKGRRLALFFTVSLSEGPKARTFFSVIPTTPTRK